MPFNILDRPCNLSFLQSTSFYFLGFETNSIKHKIRGHIINLLSKTVMRSILFHIDNPNKNWEFLTFNLVIIQPLLRHKLISSQNCLWKISGLISSVNCNLRTYHLICKVSINFFPHKHCLKWKLAEWSQSSYKIFCWLLWCWPSEVPLMLVLVAKLKKTMCSAW